MIKINARLSICIACLAGFLVVAVAWGDQQIPTRLSGKTVEDSTSKSHVQNTLKATNATEKPDETQPSGNPFRYSIPAGGFVPALRVSVPPGIKVLAIMVVQDQKPLAVLQVPGMVNVLYVRADDIIGVESRVNTTSGNLAAANSIIYLKIEKVTAQQVELSPQDNPDGKQILR